MDLTRERDTGRTANRALATGGVGLAIAGGLLLVAVVVGDLVLGDRPLNAEWPPATGAGYLVRSLLLALASFLVVVGLRRAVVSTTRPRPDWPQGPAASTIVGFGLAPAVVAALLLLVDPDALSSLVREDGLVEWGSAALAFAAGGLYAASAYLHAWRRPGPRSAMTLVALVTAAGAAFLLGLEEISWFQRVLDVDSPDFMLNHNGQQELNLHNLATGFTGNAYFVGGFLVCCALPFLAGDRALPGRLGALQPLVPTRLVLLATASSSAVVYEMWNIVWIQAAFWMTLTMLAILATTGQTATTRLTAKVVGATSLVVAAIFLVGGDDMVRSWDDTEVRELIIPYGLMLAAFESMLRASQGERAG